MNFDRSFYLFVVAGVALRCVAINQPLIDAHLLRQCQTAAATESLMRQPGFHMSSRVPWLGDLDAYYVQELPLYNYLVIGVTHLLHNLDVSGKITSILLWAASFICLQFLWRRILTTQEAFWANLLFILAPLSVFYGQAFMPEMLVQCLAFAFVLFILRYDEKPTLVRWMACNCAGIAALLVKLPETAHLYVILAFLLIHRDKWRALLKPRYWIAAIITVLLLKTWSAYVDTVNGVFLPEWTSMRNLRGFIGTFESRLQLKPWVMVFLYVGAFIVPGPAILAAAYGLWRFVRERRFEILGWWLSSLIVFYLLWLGQAPGGQSYYNLPALAPLCALFGIGMREILALRWIQSWRQGAALTSAILVILPAIAVSRYLFRQDRQVLAASFWTKANTQPSDVILFLPNHRWDFIHYPYNAVLAYYAKRPTFVLTSNSPEPYRRRALDKSNYALITLPPTRTSGLIAYLNTFRARTPPRESIEWLHDRGFRLLVNDPQFQVYERQNEP